MKFYQTDIVEKVRVERRKGLSLRKLEKLFQIPNSTISYWVRDIKSQSKAYKFARTRENKWKSQLKLIGQNFKVKKEVAQLLVSILYWCEGSKYPASNCIAFTNSDETLIKTFLNLFRYAFIIDEQKLRIRLQVHSTHDYNKEAQYWSDLLNISLKQFGKPTITQPTKKMKRLNYHGTCTIKYYDVKLLLNIIGIYESFSKRFISGEVA